MTEVIVERKSYTLKQQQHIKNYRLKHLEEMKIKDKNYRDTHKDIIKIKRDELAIKNRADPEYKNKLKAIYIKHRDDPEFIRKRNETNRLYRLKIKERNNNNVMV